jgi:hypothetical protein
MVWPSGQRKFGIPGASGGHSFLGHAGLVSAGEGGGGLVGDGLGGTGASLVAGLPGKARCTSPSFAAGFPGKARDSSRSFEAPPDARPWLSGGVSGGRQAASASAKAGVTRTSMKDRIGVLLLAASMICIDLSITILGRNREQAKERA